MKNSGETNTWASKLLGERYVKITFPNIGRSGQHGATGPFSDATTSSGIQRAEQRRPFIGPSQFTTLKRGGPANGFEVQAVAYCGGRLFGEANGDPLPYKLLTFRQK